ncbi:MAG: Rieske 2Fe-2S domain-containing protein [Brevundimonas sp.]|jgi:nitrite reductase/ring-hydroxylating ferredoxin subunit|uniref:Rieske 2Fe-2S domain-containing protein n=1 Tax=Brevundimonas sp. TaxID=1871086 RepID=UPI0025C53B7A|nr:Rieske 2Fe-2S domain-containing protein [Brevundimonas sp.]MCH4269701.1 Rieske 2Fe-2S domain-containing protein [Brevundimonas sp.]
MPAPYFDPKTGLLLDRVFASRRIFDLEQGSVFRKSWLLIAPTDWLDEPGAFVTTSMGRDPVLAWRASDGRTRVFINRCVGGSSRLAEDERGSMEVLTCPCHGWAYAAQAGATELSPIAVPRVEAFSGFIFACMDEEAPPLADWMGDFGWCWEVISRRYAGGLAVCGGASLRARLACNWKLAAEAHSGDVYSDLTLSKATREVLDLGAALAERRGLQIAAGRGAIAVTVGGGRSPEDPREDMTPVLATLFPNISYDGRGSALHVWHPRGVAETEVQTYCLAGRDDAEVHSLGARRRCQQLFGPAGLMTQDQDAVWSAISAGARTSRGHPLNLAMGLGRERRSNLPGRQSDLASEMNQRAFYEWWQEQLSTPSVPPLGDRMTVDRPSRPAPN